MTRAYYDHKPSKIEAVGNGNHLYRWDIQEETIDDAKNGDTTSTEKTVQYSCFEVTIYGKPEYGKCVEAVIRERYSLSEELAILRQRDVKPDEFAEYNAFAEECKRQVREVRREI